MLERKHPDRWGRKDRLEADIRTHREESRKKMERDKSFEDRIAALMPHVVRRDADAGSPEVSRSATFARTSLRRSWSSSTSSPGPAPELSTDERAKVKKVARELLTRIKDLLVLNWRQKAAARSALKLAIEDTLDSGLLRAYAPDMYRQKCAAIFEHVYESYPERNAGVYYEVA